MEMLKDPRRQGAPEVSHCRGTIDTSLLLQHLKLLLKGGRLALVAMCLAITSQSRLHQSAAISHLQQHAARLLLQSKASQHQHLRKFLHQVLQLPQGNALQA